MTLNQHPHAHLMAQFAEDAKRTKHPECLWMVACSAGGPWANLGRWSPPGWDHDLFYRRNPHAVLMLEWEKDQRENPSQVWQYEKKADSSWVDIVGAPVWHVADTYRRKPRTCSINGVEFPEPLREEPEEGTKVWYPAHWEPARVEKTPWEGNSDDEFMLARGQYHLTKEAALAHANAIIAATALKGA